MKSKKRQDNFKIEKKTPIIIYGAAAAGLRGYHSLKTINGYHVVGFIDKRFYELSEQCGLPVWGISENLPYRKEEVLVVICVKNVFEHERIAYHLIENGYSNIVFKPMEQKKDFDAAERNYLKVFNDDEPESVYTLENIPKLMHLQIYDFKDYAIIQRKQDTLVVNIPMQELYIKMAGQEGLLRDTDGFCSVLALTPHIALFKLFNGDGGDKKSYLDFCLSTTANSNQMYGEDGGKIEITEAWYENIIENRRIVFHRMNMEWDINPNFFIDNAPSSYLENDHLILNSAKHRAVFCVVKNKKYMPVSMDINCYERILNFSVLKEVIGFFETNKIEQINAPIAHPFFYRYPCKMPNYYEIFVFKIVLIISQIWCETANLKNVVIENGIMDEGALSRCLSRLGFQVESIYKDEEDLEFAKLLDSLFRITGIKYKKSFERADILFVSEGQISEVNNMEYTKMLFVLATDDWVPAINNFVLRKKIFETMWHNEMTAGYLFISVLDKGCIDIE